MYLYFFSSPDQINNTDWFVVADDLPEACQLWLAESSPFLDAGEEDETPQVLLPRVFLVPTNAVGFAPPRALKWHEDVREFPTTEVVAALKATQAS